MDQNVLLDYSDHANARCRARGVFRKQVQRIVRRPDLLYKRGHNHIAEYTTSSDVLIRVVYRSLAAGHEYHVVSVIRLGKLKKAMQTATLGTLHDPLLDVAYVALLNGQIAKTVEVEEGVYNDLDPYGEIAGIEIFEYRRYEATKGKQ